LAPQELRADLKKTITDCCFALPDIPHIYDYPSASGLPIRGQRYLGSW